MPDTTPAPPDAAIAEMANSTTGIVERYSRDYIPNYPRHKDSNRATEERERNCLDEELFEYVYLTSAKRFSDTYFFRALHNRHQHDVSNHNRARNQCNSRNEHHYDKNSTKIQSRRPVIALGVTIPKLSFSPG